MPPKKAAGFLVCVREFEFKLCCGLCVCVWVLCAVLHIG